MAGGRYYGVGMATINLCARCVVQLHKCGYATRCIMFFVRVHNTTMFVEFGSLGASCTRVVNKYP